MKSMPDALSKLEEVAPACDELLILHETRYQEWQLVEDISEFWRMCDETVISRVVDAFDRYLVGVVELVLRKEPRLLKSGTTMRADEILEFSTLDEVRERLISKKVDELSYAGFPAIVQYIRDRFGAPLTLPDEIFRLATEAIAVRNIVVHNGGVVNRRFVDQTQRVDLAVGTIYTLGTHEVLDLIHAVGAAADLIDKALIEHFTLSSVEVPDITNREIRQFLRPIIRVV